MSVEVFLCLGLEFLAFESVSKRGMTCIDDSKA
jgi:hypothetical protein